MSSIHIMTAGNAKPKLSTTDNILNCKPCDVLYTGYLNKGISFGNIVYFEPKNVQYKKLVIGTIGQLKYRWSMEMVMK